MRIFTVFVFVVLQLVIFTEAAFFRNLFSKRRNRVLAGGDPKEGSDKSLILDTVPNTPPSSKAVSPKNSNSSGKVFAINTEEANNNINAKKVKKASIMELKSRLSSRITEGFDTLKESSACELLQIDERLMTEILDPEDRIQFLLAAFNVDLNKRYGENAAHTPATIINFSTEIENRLNGIKNLKDYLKILVSFYKVCLRDLVFDDILKAVLKSEIFTLEELPEALGMNHEEIFDFACVNELKNVAKSLLIEDKVSRNIFGGVIEAALKGHDELVEELVELVGEKFGTGSTSLYHQILTELATIQFDK